MADKRVKILHVLDSLGIGGMERVVIDVVNGLDPAKFEQTVCCISRKGDAARYLREGAGCIDLGKGSEADHLMPLKIARVIRQERPDIIHTQSWSGVDTAIAKLMTRGTRLVHSEHGRNVPYIYCEPLKRKIARRCLYHLADAVFTISSEVQAYYCRETGFPVNRMRVIPNGVDARRIDEAARSNCRGIRQELGIAADDFVIGTVARLDRTKDTITLARAFAKLYRSHRNPRFKLLVVGDGEKKVEIQSFVIEQGFSSAVVFTGVRHDVPGLLGAMNLFALSSLSEGMPITVLEAMCASLPVVATNVGALPELVEEGVTGFLVEPGNDEDFAERISRFYGMEEMTRGFGMAGRHKVEREFRLDQMLQRYADLYLSVLIRLESRIKKK
ncbi:MAG: glycosyltransferase [Acidobacteria bacterium]|nr:glycosyltransferase [Acidobacteriota bacterium]